MKSLKRTTARGLAAGLSGALVAGAASVLAVAPAQAVEVDADTLASSLSWGVSAQAAARMSTWQFSGGAFESSAKVATFPQESVSESAGSVTVGYGGTLETQFVHEGSVLYKVVLTDPAVTIDADGSGELSAVVSSMQDLPPSNPFEESTPTRVVVGEFDASTGDPASELSATIGGFSAAFVDQIVTGVKPHFDGSNETKAPLPFTIEGKAVTATVNKARNSVAVAGTNFFGGDENYNGVYVGVAPSGSLPDTSSQEGMAAFAGQEWVMAHQVVDGAFNRTVAIETGEVKAGVEYSVYTWQAHRHSTNALDTETPIGVLKDAPAKKKATTTNFKFNKKANRKKAGRITVTVKSGQAKPRGKVRATIKIAGVKKAKKVTKKLNKNSKVKFKLPKAKKKVQYKVTVKYLGNKNYKASKKVKKYKVKK